MEGPPARPPPRSNIASDDRGHVASARCPPATTLHRCKSRRLNLRGRLVRRIARTDTSQPCRSGAVSVTLYTVSSIPEAPGRVGRMMNRIARSFLIGTMAFVLLALTPLSAQASQGLTHVQHPNVLVTIDPEASSQNEVTIAAFPSDRNILVATARDTRQASGFSWAGYYRSTDRGDTWQNALAPAVPGGSSPHGLSSPVHPARS